MILFNNIRDDFLHKLSTSIINENQVIVVEDLDVKKMFQTKKLAKVLGDISISKFISMLEYKAFRVWKKTNQSK